MTVHIQLRKTQAEDIASLSHTAGWAGQSQLLQSMQIEVGDFVQFSTTNSYVVGARRGTLGEFGGHVSGTGIFGVHARKLAKALRQAVQSSDGDFTMSFGNGYVEVNGHTVYAENLERHQLIAARVVNSMFDMVGSNREAPEYKGQLPIFDMKMFRLLTKAVGNGADTTFPLHAMGRGKWGIATPTYDSWRFAGALMEKHFA